MAGTELISVDADDMTTAAQKIRARQGVLSEKRRARMPVIFSDTKEYEGDSEFSAGFCPVAEIMDKRGEEIETMLQNLSLAIENARDVLFGADSNAQKGVSGDSWLKYGEW